MEGKLEEIKELKKKITELEAKKNEILSEYYEKMKPLREQMDRLEAERNNKVKKYDREITDLMHRAIIMELREKEEQKKREFEAFMSGGEMTEKAIEFMIGLKEDDKVDINIRGGKLQNGIRIVKVIYKGYWDDGDMRYLAFYGTKLIGIWTRRRAEHRGDETIPYAFLTTLEGKTEPDDLQTDARLYEVINDAKDSLFNIIYKKGDVITLKQRKNISNARYKTKELTFNAWKRYLKSLTQEELENAPAMDIDKPVCQKMLTEWGWMW